MFWKTSFFSFFFLDSGFSEASHWCLNADSQNRLCPPLLYLQDAERRVLKTHAFCAIHAAHTIKEKHPRA